MQALPEPTQTRGKTQGSERGPNPGSQDVLPPQTWLRASGSAALCLHHSRTGGGAWEGSWSRPQKSLPILRQLTGPSQTFRKGVSWFPGEISPGYLQLPSACLRDGRRILCSQRCLQRETFRWPLFQSTVEFGDHQEVTCLLGPLLSHSEKWVVDSCPA